MKRVLIAMYDMHCGGVEKALVDLLKVLSSEKEWKIDLMVLEKQGEFLERVPKSVNIIECPIPKEVFLYAVKSTKDALKYSLLYHQAYIPKIVKRYFKNRGKFQQDILKRDYEEWNCLLPEVKENYDLAIDFQGMGCFTTFYVAQKIKADVKVSWIHNDVSAQRGDLLWQEYYYKKYARIYCVSKEAAKRTAECMPFVKDKIDIFYNIVPKEEIIARANEAAQELRGKCKILTIGRLSFQKGYDVALEALKIVKDEGYIFDYYIVGDGEERANLEKSISEKGLNKNVHLLGYQENPYKYLKQCDIYFQPSRFEGFCITLSEAKIFDKPIITTDFAGAWEQIENGVNGIVIPCTKDSMAFALKNMMNNPLMRNQFIKRLEENPFVVKDDCEKLRKLLH